MRLSPFSAEPVDSAESLWSPFFLSRSRVHRLLSSSCRNFPRARSLLRQFPLRAKSSPPGAKSSPPETESSSSNVDLSSPHKLLHDFPSVITLALINRMPRQSKRELLPPPHPFVTSFPSGGMSPAAPPGSFGPACWENIGRIMKAYVIIHSMIVEDEKEMVKFPIDLNEQGGSSIALPPEVQKGGGPIFSEILRRRAEIHHQPTHKQLKKDLIEHIWQKFANRRNN